MRPVRTAAARAEVEALMEDRRQWQAKLGYTDARQHCPDSDTDEVGLYEDDVLVGYMRLHHRPVLEHWGPLGGEPCVLISHAHSVPGRQEGIGQLMTLWAADFAARIGCTWVRCEVREPKPGTATAPVPGRLSAYLQDQCGWQQVQLRTLTSFERLSHLQVRAQARPGLTPMIRTDVAVPFQCLPVEGEADHG
ncbi:hypothetical protein ACFWY6_32210 [Streptomyces sp. NPDC059037]|uniref:hypothetical protein n=1 Tax=Streptomyces sp. NPDC059037 TaxID=3346710 RepID=UPI0036B04A1F